MRVAGMEPKADNSAGLLEDNVLAPDGPLAGQGPLVEAQALRKFVGMALVEDPTILRREVLAAAVAEVCLWRPQLVPFGFGFYADAGHRSELARDSEQPLDEALRFL